jgi:hypothetical protein
MVFAIRRMDESKAGVPSSAGAAGERPATSTSSTGATSSNTTSTDQKPSSGAQNTEGAWYRLTPMATQDLKQYIGQRVRVNDN